MADAENAHTTAAERPSRRALLTGAAGSAAALSTSAVPRPARASDGSDAELIALCAAYHRAYEHEAAIVRRLFEVKERDWSEEDRCAYEEAGAAECELRRRIFDTKATTLAGCKAKAGVVDLWFATDADGDLHSPDDWPAASLVNDLLALAEGGA